MQEKMILSIDELSVLFPNDEMTSAIPVLNKASLNLKKGEIVALVGESGSGKTILSRAIMNLIPSPGYISDGKIIFNELNLLDLQREEMVKIRGRKISLIVSNPKGELDPLETVGQQICNVLIHHLDFSYSQAKKKAISLLRDVRIPDPESRFNAFPHELSGGMAQRVIIAIALACDPELIISDDATSGLDVTVQAQVLDLLDKLVREKGSSLIFITRDLGVAAHFADQIMVIYKGQIVEKNNVQDFFKDPKHPYSNLLLASFSNDPEIKKIWTQKLSLEPEDISIKKCVFCDRCIKAKPKCFHSEPEMIAIGDDLQVRCFNPIERAL